MIYVIFIIILALILLYLWETIKINYIVWLIVNRGILAPNCFWWNISDSFLKDASGVKLYYDVKETYNQKIVPINMLGYKINLVLDIGFTETILNNSPFIFGVGKLKYKIFKSFMPENVGVSQGLEWLNRRTLNTRVLDTNQIHKYAEYFDKFIYTALNKAPQVPSNFTQFTAVARQITNKIVFNRDKIEPAVYQIFSEANSLQALLTDNYRIDPVVYNSYRKYLHESIDNPQFPSLVELSTKYSNNVPELMQQIPHWIFPTVGLINTTFPRLLLIMINHPDKLNKLIDEINSKIIEDNLNSRQPSPYLRQCILETLRLNNPVVTTFRTLLQDFSFDEHYKYKKNDQFLILNNPILRSPDYFVEPNKFQPERWTAEMENSYYAIMFNQGPQKCPGKDLAMFILQSFTIHYLKLSKILQYGPSIVTTQSINVDDMPQMINPCGITFEFNQPHI